MAVGFRVSLGLRTKRGSALLKRDSIIVENQFSLEKKIFDVAQVSTFVCYKSSNIHHWLVLALNLNYVCYS